MFCNFFESLIEFDFKSVSKGFHQDWNQILWMNETCGFHLFQQLRCFKATWRNAPAKTCGSSCGSCGICGEVAGRKGSGRVCPKESLLCPLSLSLSLCIWYELEYMYVYIYIFIHMCVGLHFLEQTLYCAEVGPSKHTSEAYSRNIPSQNIYVWSLAQLW